MSTQTFLVIGATGKTGHYTVPEFMIQHFCAVALDYQNGIFSDEDKMIAELTGKRPMTVQDFVASHREAFRTASAVRGAFSPTNVGKPPRSSPFHM